MTRSARLRCTCGRKVYSPRRPIEHARTWVTLVGDVALDPGSARDRLAAARLYAITPDASPSAVRRLVAAWLRGGVDVVQLRHKSLPRGELLMLARELAAACSEADALFVVNDHLDVAMLSGADGVHLGPDDLSVAAARRVAGPALLVGASAASPGVAAAAEAAGADYLGSGPAYPTPIKTEKRVIGPEGIAAVAAAVRLPVFAIGGVDRTRLAPLRAAGLERVCVIRALAEAADPEAEARAFRAHLTTA
jgi:thiamine-phosphate pyrophosphorylase